VADRGMSPAVNIQIRRDLAAVLVGEWGTAA
jgi:hypothetical protein